MQYLCCRTRELDPGGVRILGPLKVSHVDGAIHRGAKQLRRHSMDIGHGTDGRGHPWEDANVAT